MSHIRLHRKLFLAFVVLIACGSAEYPEKVADSSDEANNVTSELAPAAA
jgi:hypothetical protein